jgi:putative heme degradation protein
LFSFGYCSRDVASHLPVVVLHSWMLQTGTRVEPLFHRLQTRTVHFGTILPQTFVSTAVHARLGSFKKSSRTGERSQL